MKVLFLVSDAFGGFGGISRFNCDFASALVQAPGVESLVVLPRSTSSPVQDVPPKALQRPPRRHKLQYVLAAMAEASSGFDLVICGHINLMPAAELACRAAVLQGRRPRLALVIHGVDAWERVRVPGLSRLDRVISVSRFTLDRFRAWSGTPVERCVILPNTVDCSRFTPGPPNAHLVQRYGLHGAEVLMGLARLEAAERQKGFDEMLSVLPNLVARRPRLKYLLCGDGSDRPRLEATVARLGLSERVVFVGRIPEPEKVDHYRLAHAFALCGWQEGFGIVLLEAMACGVPVVASCRDGSADAVDGGRLGDLADPGNGADLAAAVLRALDRPSGHVPPSLESLFGHRAFTRRVAEIVETLD